ncbi:MULTISPECIES: TonB-dependent receptor [unclassified Brevundimonas]|uniref:TonB-dependent receptor n=1 Tax=unclassified Brevundimonas TaxID=2622653 RepID=UPI0025B9304B|nr:MULTISPECIES: TonB-dependent receptor [unclassified Brevundimonas]
MSTKTTRSKLYLAATALGTVLLSSGQVWAQSADDTQVASAVDDIVVTARLRKETLQEVPAAISAFSSETMAKAGIQNLETLAAATPGLSFQSIGGTYQAPVIRGLAQIDQTAPIGNVGVFVDGIYLNNRSGLEFGYLDLARVEVVKGPQSALYGRNTFSGAINYVSKEPTLGYYSGSVQAEIGDYGRRSLQGSLSIPIGEIAAIRVWGGEGEFDGTIDNRRDGGHLGGYDLRRNLGASLLFQPTDRFSARFFHMRTDTFEDQAPYAFVETYDNNCGSQTTGPRGDRMTLYCGSLPYPESVDLDTEAATGLTGYSTLSYATASYDMDFATVTATLGYTYAKFGQNNDGTGRADAISTPLAPGSQLSQQSYAQTVGDASDELSFDLKLTSSADQRLRWIVGVYAFDGSISDGLYSYYAHLNDPSTLTLNFARGGTMELSGKAIYASADYDFTDRLTLSVEGRYSSETQTYEGAAATGGAKGEQDYNYFTPKASLKFQYSPDTMFYASAAHGYKIGGFNSQAGGKPEFTFDPETNWSYEAGVKSTMFDRKLQFSTSIFYIDWTDIQVQGAIPGASLAVTQNNEGATSYGIEWDSTYYFTPNLSLRTSFALMDPTYKDGTEDAEIAAPCGRMIGTAITEPGCSIDVGGKQLSRTTKAQYSIGGEYTLPQLVGDFDGYVRVDYSWQEAKPSTSLNWDTQGDLALTNLQVGLQNGRITIAGWVRNLFDEEYLARATFTPSTLDGAPVTGVVQTRVYPGERRTMGLRVSYAF